MRMKRLGGETPRLFQGGIQGIWGTWLRNRSPWQVGQPLKHHHQQTGVKGSTSTELGHEWAGTRVPGHAGAQGSRAAPQGAGWSPGVGRRLSKPGRVAGHQTGRCLLPPPPPPLPCMETARERCCLLPTQTGDTRGPRDKGQPGCHALHPCPSVGVTEQREIPAKTLILIF